MARQTNLTRGSASGVTLPELLVVICIIALALAVAIPLVSQSIRTAQVRSAASQFAVTVKAVRMIAVTKQEPTTLSVQVHPDNYYEYVDSNGRARRIGVPGGVRIAAASTPRSIRFEPNGALDSEALTFFETDVADDRHEVWQVKTTLMGVSSVDRLGR